MKKLFDVAVIGSGPTGAIAASTLVKRGFSVLLLDGGVDESDIIQNWPQQSFTDFRKNSTLQRELFLGTSLSALSEKNTTHSASSVSGLKEYVSKFTQSQLPIKSDVNLLQTLSLGGFSNAWGGACDIFSTKELKATGIPVENFNSYYQAVISEIGMSGNKKPFVTQPPILLDSHATMLLHRYEKQKAYFKKESIEVYQPLLALLTHPTNNRQATSYTDMDYWINTGKSLYRSKYTIDSLLTNSRFTLRTGYIVKSVKSNKKDVSIFAQDLHNKTQVQFAAKKVVLAAGSINSIRIVSTSLGLHGKKFPFLIKSHVVSPCLNTAHIGKPGSENRVSLCQLVATNSSHSSDDVWYSQLYSYRSLLLYKLVSQTPLPTPLALSALALLTPNLVLADTRFPSTYTQETSLSSQIHFDKTVMSVHAPLNAQVALTNSSQSLKKATRCFLKLGLIPLKNMYMPTGSTAHYAGGIPFQNKSLSQYKFPVTTTQSGEVTGLPHVFIADMTTWNYLPPKPPTLTAMANAVRIAKNM